MYGFVFIIPWGLTDTCLPYSVVYDGNKDVLFASFVF